MRRTKFVIHKKHNTSAEFILAKNIPENMGLIFYILTNVKTLVETKLISIYVEY